MTEDQLREALGLRPFSVDDVEPDFKSVYCSHEAADAVKARLRSMNAYIYASAYSDEKTTEIVYYK